MGEGKLALWTRRAGRIGAVAALCLMVRALSPAVDAWAGPRIADGRFAGWILWAATGVAPPENLQPMTPAVEEPSRDDFAPPAGEAGEDPYLAASGGDDAPLEITPLTGENIVLNNKAGIEVDVEGLIARALTFGTGGRVLIIHTHGSEAYTPAGVDRYEANDQGRTADTEFNIVRVGDELAERLSAAGLRVLHDREIYDYPSYTGSYARSGEAVEEYLREYPSLAVVLDVHRDALGAEDVVYKTMAEEEGVVASQIMILVGTDESGLEHPNWRTNLSLALYLQESVGRLHPTLMRPVSVVPQRYNQQLTGGSLILEVGSSGNTLREALAAVRLFADAAGPALLALVDGGAAEETGA